MSIEQIMSQQSPRVSHSIDPEIEPFYFNSKQRFKLMVLHLALPLFIGSAIVGFVVFQPSVNVLLGILALLALLYLVSFIETIRNQQKLHNFQLQGSILSEFKNILFRSFFSIQSLFFPILLILVFVSILNPDKGVSQLLESSSNLIPVIVLILPLVAYFLMYSNLMNYITANDDRIVKIAESIPSEEFRNEIKSYGEKLHFNDVKLRLGHLSVNNYCNPSYAVNKSGVVYCAYSSVAYHNAESEQNKILVKRDLLRLSIKDTSYLRTMFISNIFTFVYISLIGIIFMIVSKNTTFIDLELSDNEFLLIVIIAIIAMIGQILLRPYKGIHDLLAELTADKDAIEQLSAEGHNQEVIVDTLKSITKIDPLLGSASGYKLRLRFLRNYKVEIPEEEISPADKVQSEKKIRWEDL